MDDVKGVLRDAELMSSMLESIGLSQAAEVFAKRLMHNQIRLFRIFPRFSDFPALVLTLNFMDLMHTL